MAGGSVEKRAAARQEAIEWVARMCAAVRQAVEADRVIAWLYDAHRQSVSPLAVDSPSGIDELPPEWAAIPLVQMPAAVAVLLEAQRVEIEDAQDDDRVPPELAADLGMTSVRFEPLIAGGTVGMLSIERAPREAAPELQALLGMVAAAVARAGGMLESDRDSAESSFLLKLTEAASRAASLDEMLSVVCEHAARVIGARRATVLLEEDGRLAPRACRYADGSRDVAEWDAMRNSNNLPPAARAAFDSGEPVVATGAASPLIGTWGASSFEIQALLAVPLRMPAGVIGVMVLDDASPDPFSAENVRLAAAAAEHVTPQIDQARTSDERGWHLRAATAIRRLLEEGARATTVEEAGEVLARVTREAVGAESATLLLRGEEDRVVHALTVGAGGEFEDTLRQYVGDVPADDFRVWRIAARQARPIFVENARASRLLPPELVDALALKSYLVVPLVSATRPLGVVLCTHSNSHRPWSNEERRLVEQLALEGSLVVENALLRASEQERMEELSHAAFHDSLTELPNRVLLADRLELALARTNRRKAAVAVLFLDLDDFKPINDNYGHDAGDRLLISVAQRIKACVRPEDTVARLGGDEFTILLEDIVDVRYAISVAERIEESLQEPIEIDGHQARVTASIGIAVSTGRESTPEDLMRDSDLAMYLAKRKGRARHELFSEEAAQLPQVGAGDEAAGDDGHRADPAGGDSTDLPDQLSRSPVPEELRDGAGDQPQAASEGSPNTRAGEDLAVQEMAQEVSVAEAIVVEEAPSIDLDDDHEADDEDDDADAREALLEGDGSDLDAPTDARADQPDEAADQAFEGEAPPDDGAAALTEARRRRRLRFPPRR